MIGTLNKKEIESLLKRQVIGRIGCHADGVTYVVPISYAYDGKNIYAHTFSGMKMDLMHKNPKVCFQVDDTRNLSNWQSVITWGEFQEITDEPGKNEALRILNNRVVPIPSSETMHITPDWPFSPEKLDKVSGIFFRILITKKTGRFEKTSAEFFYGT